MAKLGTLKQQLYDFWNYFNINNNYNIIRRYIFQLTYNISVYKPDFNCSTTIANYTTSEYKAQLFPIIFVLPAYNKLCRDFLNYAISNQDLAANKIRLFDSVADSIIRTCEKLSSQKYGTLWMHLK